MVALFEATMTDELRAWFLLGAFAGLRSIEVRRMRWEDIDAEAGEIFIGLDVSKQSSGLPQRIVDFTEPLTRRAEFFKGRTGHIVPPKSLRLYREREKLIARMHKEKKLPWPALPDNVLRHSFATYHLADCKDPQKTAHQLGHSSAKMVREVYAVPARRSNAQAWWSI
jgi:integrase